MNIKGNKKKDLFKKIIIIIILNNIFFNSEFHQLQQLVVKEYMIV